MIRASARTKDGKLLLIFGISEENVKRLKEDKPMHFQADDLGLKAEVIIFYAESELELAHIGRSLLTGEMSIEEDKDATS